MSTEHPVGLNWPDDAAGVRLLRRPSAAESRERRARYAELLATDLAEGRWPDVLAHAQDLRDGRPLPSRTPTAPTP